MAAADQAVSSAAGQSAASAAGGAPAASGSAASIPIPRQDAVFSWSGYFEALAWLCFLLALLWLVLWLMKKRGFSGLPGFSQHMQIESRLALGPKKWIIVTRYRDKRLVLGVTDQQITLLTEMPLGDDEEADFAGPPAQNHGACDGSEGNALPGFLRTALRRKRGQGGRPADVADNATDNAPNAPEASGDAAFAVIMKKETGDA